MTIIFLLEIVYFAIYITLDLSLFFVISNFMLPSNLARSCFMLFKPQMAFFLLFHFQKHCFYLFHLNFFLKSNFYSTSILKFIQKIKKIFISAVLKFVSVTLIVLFKTPCSILYVIVVSFFGLVH